MNRRWVVVFALLAVMLIVGAVAWNARRPGPPPPNMRAIRIAYVPFSADLPFFVAIEKGYFEREGLRVTPVKAANSSELMNALVSGDVQAIAPVGFAAIFGVEQRSPGTLKAYLPGGETQGHVVSNILVRKGSQITSPEQLRGKKIGTYTGSTQLVNLRLILAGIGINPDKDITIVQVDPSLQVQALEAGQFDALFSVEPFTTAALAKGIAQSLVDNPRAKYIVDPFASGAFVLTKDLLGRDLDLAQRIYRAMHSGVVFLQQYPNEAKGMLAKYTSTTPEVLKLTDLYAFFPTDDGTLNAIQKLADLSTEQGLLDGRLDVKSLFSEESRLAAVK